MQKIMPPAAQDLAFVIGPYQEPIARVHPGETFQVSTLDAFGNRIDSPDLDLIEIIQLHYVNPCTGPIFIEGAVTRHSRCGPRDPGRGYVASGRLLCHDNEVDPTQEQNRKSDQRHQCPSH